MAPGRRRSPSRTSTYLASRKRASRSGSRGRVLRSSRSSMKVCATASSSSSEAAGPILRRAVLAALRERQEAGSEGSVAGAGQVNLQGDGAPLQGARGGADAFIGGRAGQKSLSLAWLRRLRMGVSSSRRLEGPRPAARAWAISEGMDGAEELGARLGFGSVGIGSLLGLGGTMRQVPASGKSLPEAFLLVAAGRKEAVVRYKVCKRTRKERRLKTPEVI